MKTKTTSIPSPILLWAITLALPIFAVCGYAQEKPAAKRGHGQREFFESRVRPVLVEHCYQCHNSIDTAEGGLALDSRAALLQGGDGGKVVLPGKPAASRLLATIRHEIDGLEMPEDGAKLQAHVIADIERWIADGAYDPRDQPPSENELADAISWETTLQRRKQWWSFQPIRAAQSPSVKGGDSAVHPIDRFVRAKLEEADLVPSDVAEPAVLVRRLFFNLIGIPPSIEASRIWTERLSQAADGQRSGVIEQLVDSLLDDPRYGERWARHWMDWIRYAESHGSEGDPEIVGAWQYRDYLIRALNADVPIDQLIREHVAGDILPNPRINEKRGINESAIGPAHWRMVFHGFAPTDALDEKVRFIDDQINSFSKAFLGLTVSCSRCHDHKFDAISQRDYYALFGILSSCRPGRQVVETEERKRLHWDRLSALKPRIREAIAKDWLGQLDRLQESLDADDGPWQSAERREMLLHPIYQLRKSTDGEADFASAWATISSRYRVDDASSISPSADRIDWNLTKPSVYQDWFAVGIGLPSQPSAAGEFAIEPTGKQILTGIYPSGIYSHRLSTKHPARLMSPDFTIQDEMELWVQVVGAKNSTVRYAVHDYPRSGTVYPVKPLSDQWSWQRFDLSYWSGDEAHVELATAADAPLLSKNQPRSWFGVRGAFLRHKDQTLPPEWQLDWEARKVQPVLAAASESPPKSLAELTKLYANTIQSAIQAWRDETASDAQALLLDACLREGLLGNQTKTLSNAKPLVEEYRRLESEIPEFTRVPSLDETIGRDQSLFHRGNHKNPGEPVPRRFLEAIDSAPYETLASGRIELADDLLRADNPLTRRVLVNRVWHHLFGSGIVSTPDNFGRLGALPSHPELLDWLALRFEEQDWSLRKLVRLIATSKTWQQSSQPSRDALQADPENRLLSHANVRRLEAESIRDKLLAVSGQLQQQLEGPPVSGNAPRRSIYVRVRRNALDSFLRAFDFPEPSATVGRRDVTNVPAQSLTMLNDARVSGYAREWAKRTLQIEAESPNVNRQRVEAMFTEAFARRPNEFEVNRALEYLEVVREELEQQRLRASELRGSIANCNDQIEAIKSPIRQRLLEQVGEDKTARSGFLPTPVANWEFDQNADDAIGGIKGELRGGAEVADGALVVRRGGHVVTEALPVDLKTKTLAAWVQLDHFDQRAGGVMTVQTRNGVVFDSIVFAERDPKQWLAGSNNFARTQPFGGPQERDAVSKPVHLAISYDADGMITGYRNGKLYGKPYKSNGPNLFRADETVVSFGVRHLPAGGNRLLSGKILQAQLYDRALSAEEIAAIHADSPRYVPEQRVLEELSPDQQKRIDQLSAELARSNRKLRQMGPIPKQINDVAVWTELARALFTTKEFIYVR